MNIQAGLQHEFFWNSFSDLYIESKRFPHCGQFSYITTRHGFTYATSSVSNHYKCSDNKSLISLIDSSFDL